MTVPSPSEHYFSDRCNKSVEVKRDTYTTCALQIGHEGKCEGAIPGYQVSVPSPDPGVPALPWTWIGGYPQRITGPDASLIAEVWENPDAPAIIAPLICDAVNARFGVDASKTYKESL